MNIEIKKQKKVDIAKKKTLEEENYQRNIQ